MNPTLRNVIRSTLLLCIAGAALAFAAPVMAPLFGFTAEWAAAAYPPLWTGVFFGLFGAAQALVSPVLDAFMGSPANEKPHMHVPVAGLEQAKGQGHEQAQNPPLLVANTVSAQQEVTAPSSHAARLHAERTQLQPTNQRS